MKTNDFFFPSADGITTIHGIEWLPDEGTPVRGIIQIAHGFSEHIGYYNEFAEYFTDKGFIIRGNDHIGHGLSVAPDRPRLHFGPQNSWHPVVEDIFYCRRLADKTYADLPYFLLGFSLGSYLVRDYLIKHEDSLSGAILIGSGLYSNFSLTLMDFLVKRDLKKHDEKEATAVTHMLMHDYNTKKIKNATSDYDWLFQSKDALDEFTSDPLCGGEASLGLFRELLYGIRFTCDSANISQLNSSVPICLLSGFGDIIAQKGKNIEKLKQFLEKNGYSNVSMKIYQNGRHCILKDECKNNVFSDIYDWISDILSERSSYEKS